MNKVECLTTGTIITNQNVSNVRTQPCLGGVLKPNTWLTVRVEVRLFVTYFYVDNVYFGSAALGNNKASYKVGLLTPNGEGYVAFVKSFRVDEALTVRCRCYFINTVQLYCHSSVT